MWDVLYAIDASSSMGEASSLRGAAGESKLGAVKKAIEWLVGSSRFPSGARVGVLAFRAPTKAMGLVVDSRQQMTQLVLGFTPVTDLRDNPQALRRALDAMKVGGATPTGEGLKAAARALDSKADAKKRINKIVLVTDDKSNFGPKPEAMFDAEMVRRAIVDVVAIQKAGDVKWFQTLASRSGGKLMVVEDAGGLSAALDPKIPYASELPVDPLIVEAGRIAEVLKMTAKGDSSHQGLSAAAGAVRRRLEQKLQETVALEGQARADLDQVVSAATRDPKYPVMSMKEFADRVWARGADVAKMQGYEGAFRRALKLLP